MKKTLSLMLALALALSLTGCRRRQAEAPAEEATSARGPAFTITDGSNFEPEQENSVPDPLATLTPQERAAVQVGTADDDFPVEDVAPPGGEQSADSDLFAPIEAGTELATDAAGDPQPATAATPSPIVNTAAYQYAAVMDDNLDYTFNYPTHWEHVPGIYTVCYREVVEKGDFPARISVCRKKLVHTPDDIAMMEQLTSYMKMVAERYDSATFQASTPDKEVKFMGHQALANTYLAYWGDIEVKGYVIGVAINRTLYVLHFCATYADYIALENVMQYMINSVQLKEAEK